jgi:hypothetical protein
MWMLDETIFWSKILPEQKATVTAQYNENHDLFFIQAKES